MATTAADNRLGPARGVRATPWGSDPGGGEVRQARRSLEGEGADTADEEGLRARLARSARRAHAPGVIGPLAKMAPFDKPGLVEGGTAAMASTEQSRVATERPGGNKRTSPSLAGEGRQRKVRRRPP